MGRMARRVAAALLLVAAALAQAAAAPAIADADSSAARPASTLSGTRLVSALRRGGYVVYFRHAATDMSRNDAAMKGFDDCENQRPLSAPGRRDAEAIGAAIRRLRLPMGEILASPFCRTLETARLMLGQPERRPDIREAQAGDYAGLKRLLATPVAAGRNRWIVGHGIPFRAVAGPPHLAEGEAAVIEPRTTGWTVVARIGVSDWQALAMHR